MADDDKRKKELKGFDLKKETLDLLFPTTGRQIKIPFWAKPEEKEKEKPKEVLPPIEVQKEVAKQPSISEEKMLGLFQENKHIKLAVSYIQKDNIIYSNFVSEIISKEEPFLGMEPTRRERVASRSKEMLNYRHSAPVNVLFNPDNLEGFVANTIKDVIKNPDKKKRALGAYEKISAALSRVCKLEGKDEKACRNNIYAQMKASFISSGLLSKEDF